MSEPTLITLFVAPLNRLRLPYMITGAVAAALYGEPHLRDIAAMLDVSAGRVDVTAVERWVAELDLHKEWRRARRDVV